MRRVILALALVLVFSQPSFAIWTSAQAFGKQEVGANQTTAVRTMTSTPTTGNLLVAVLNWYDGTNNTAGTVTIKDANLVAFTITASSPSNARPTTAGIVYLAYLQAPASPNGVITATFNTTGAVGVATLWVAEFQPSSGTNGGLDSDGNATGTDLVTPFLITSPTVTVNQANDLVVVAALCDHQVSTVDSPWVQAVAGTGNQFSEGIGYILDQGSSVAAAMTMNASGGWDSIGASFKFTAAGGGGCGGSFISLLGVGKC